MAASSIQHGKDVQGLRLLLLMFMKITKQLLSIHLTNTMVEYHPSAAKVKIFVLYVLMLV